MRAATTSKSFATIRTLIADVYEQVMESLPDARRLEERILTKCAIKLFDLVDQISLPLDERSLLAAGFVPCTNDGVWRASQEASLPAILTHPNPTLTLRVEQIEAFAAAAEIAAPTIEYPKHDPVRRARLFSGARATVFAVEHRRWEHVPYATAGERKLRRAQLHQQAFRSRRRVFRDCPSGFAYSERLIACAVADLGAAWTLDLFLRAEREHWIARCAVGALLNLRQTRLGVGWANVDHYIYRASREHLEDTLRLLGRLGYGPDGLLVSAEAPGTAVHVLAHKSGAPILVEVDRDAGQDGDSLQPLTWHDRSGLWCALHGEPLLDGGILRVAARYDCARLRTILQDENITAVFENIGPPSGLVFAGEPQAIVSARLDTLGRAGYLSPRQCERLRLEGVVLSDFQAIDRGSDRPNFEFPSDSTGLTPPSEPIADFSKRRRTRMRRRGKDIDGKDTAS